MEKLIFTFLCLFLAIPCAADTIIVDPNGTGDYPTIQAAINDSNDGDVIVLQLGTYTSDGNRDIDFGGKAITVRSTDPNDSNIVAATIIDCNGTESENHRGFWFHNGEDTNSVLSGLTITKGYNFYGGGVYCDSSSPAIRNCNFIDNRWGGGILCFKSSTLISSCHFKSNTNNEGGAITLIKDCFGVIEECLINRNTATFTGGGIYCVNNCSPTISTCTILGNTARGEGPFSSYGGGGICLQNNSHPTIIDCIIKNNIAAGSSGGGISGGGNSPSIINCTISGNWAGEKGGGLAGCDGSISNCTISGNTVKGEWEGSGGGLYECNGDIVNCTISDNTAEGEYSEGGGLAGCDGSISNCIIWGNVAEEDSQVSSSVAPTYSCIEDWTGGGEGDIDADPCFVEPGYWASDPNGDFWVEGDYHLLADSPGIDAGDNTAVPPDTTDLDSDGDTTERIPFDIDGNSRFVDVPPPGGTGVPGPPDYNEIVDMGAYEFFVPPMEVAMRFTPKVLNARSKGRWVKAHFVLPEGFAVEDVDANTPAVIEPLGIESDYINVFINEEGLVEIEAAFGRAAFCGGAGYGPAEVTVVGTFASGGYFYGTDTIRIITGNLKFLAALASQWLQADCRGPDWCGGVDLDHSSAVNFVDFAIFDGCCIEIITQ